MTHILIIDNDPDARTLLADTLLSSGPEMTVATAAHGCKSLDQYQEHHPDLVIAEIRRQELDGIDTILNFRELDRELPVLLTSRGLPIMLALRRLPITAFHATATASNAVRRCSLLSAVRTCLARSVARPKKTARSIDPSPDDPRPSP